MSYSGALATLLSCGATLEALFGAADCSGAALLPVLDKYMLGDAGS